MSYTGQDSSKPATFMMVVVVVVVVVLKNSLVYSWIEINFQLSPS